MQTTSHPYGFWTPPTWVLMGLLIVGVLMFKMVLPLISGLVLFVLIVELHKLLHPKMSPLKAMVASTLLGVGVFLGTLTLGLFGVFTMVDTEKGIAPLMVQLTQALSMIKEILPAWISSYIPSNAYTLLHQAQLWLTENTELIANWGKKLISVVFRVVVGAFVGLLVAVRVMRAHNNVDPAVFPHPYLKSLARHIHTFAHSFKRVFFAQFYIALVNTAFTGIFLGVAMPLLGYNIPFLGMLLTITFIMGFIPIIGNIVSNTVITLTSLAVAPLAAFLALIFLIVIHKLEYFLNAWIVGNKIKVRSYELLISMLCLEALFGVWGLVLAPVVYSYAKEEFILGASSPKDKPTPH